MEFVQVWAGQVTWRQVAELREQLFDAIDSNSAELILDVRGVTEMAGP